MKTFQEQFEEFKKFLQASTWSVRILSTLLAALVIVGLAFLFRTQSNGGGEYIYGGRDLSIDELIALEDAFAQAGLNESEIVGSRMRVPSAKKYEYLAAAGAAGALPKGFGALQVEAGENAGMFESKYSQEYRRDVARQGELSKIVSQFPGVLRATVQIDERSIGFPPKTEKRAMVAVNTIGNRPLEPQRVSAIRRLISGAVAGLEVADVTVTDLNSGISWDPEPAEGSSEGVASAYLAYKKSYEDDWQHKIRSQLSWVPGVVVGVNVALDPEMSHSQSSMKIDPKTVNVRSSDTSEDRTSSSVEDGGRPGAVPNGVVSNQGARIDAAQTKRNEQTTKTATETEAIASRDWTVIQKAGLTPDRVTASILVPESYYVAVWNRNRPPAAAATAATPSPATGAGTTAAPTDAELATIRESVKKKIEEAVVGLLPPLPAGIDPFPRVVVNSYEDLRGEPLPEPTYAALAMDWGLANWQKLGLGALALISLAFLHRLVKQRPASPDAARQAAANAESDDESEEGSADRREAGAAEDAAARRRFAESGPDLKEELADLVRDDEDAAVNVLKSWISEAA